MKTIITSNYLSLLENCDLSMNFVLICFVCALLKFIGLQWFMVIFDTSWIDWSEKLLLDPYSYSLHTTQWPAVKQLLSCLKKLKAEGSNFKYTDMYLVTLSFSVSLPFCTGWLALFNVSHIFLCLYELSIPEHYSVFVLSFSSKCIPRNYWLLLI